MTTLERFLNKVDKTSNPNGCWEWTAFKNRNGYGRFIDNGQWMAHRWAAKNLGNMDLQDFCVCHTCDNPGCVNPAHLFLGTHTDNMRDKVAKGRASLGNRSEELLGHKIQTPLGIFSSISSAAKAHGWHKSGSQIYFRLNRFPEEYKRVI